MPEHSKRNIIMLIVFLALIILAMLLFLPWPQFLVTTIALLMFLIPFLPAISELNFPKDNKPLNIDMMYYKDPFYFGESFKRIITEAVKSVEGVDEVTDPDYLTKLILSHDEAVKIYNTDQNLSEGPYENTVYIKGNLFAGERVMFAREVYVTGNARLSPNSLVRALYCDGNVEIGEETGITRWLCGKRDMIIGAGSFLGRSASAAGLLKLGPKVRFSSLYGDPISTFFAEQPQIKPVAPFNRDKRDLPVIWKVLKKGLLVSLPFEPDNRPDVKNIDLSDLSKQIKKTNSRQYEIKAESQINPDLVVKRDLLINEKVVCFGNLKGYRNIILKNDVVVHGNIFAEGNVLVGENCCILGNIFSQGRIEIKAGAIVGRDGKVKSLIGKKAVRLEKQVLIYGYVLTEGQGEIV